MTAPKTQSAVSEAEVEAAAAVLDHPSVYMGGPSDRSKRLARAALEAAALVPAGQGEGEIERLTQGRDLARAAAEDYDRDCTDMRYQRDSAEAERDRLAGEVERAREALTFYADPESYRSTGWQGDADPAPVMVDRGTKAAALVSDPAEGEN